MEREEESFVSSSKGKECILLTAILSLLELMLLPFGDLERTDRRVLAAVVVVLA